MWVFLYIKYSKFWSISLEHFIERKPLISEEWPAVFVTIFPKLKWGDFFPNPNTQCIVKSWYLLYHFHACMSMYFLTLEKISPIFLIVNSESPKKGLSVIQWNESNCKVDLIWEPALNQKFTGFPAKIRAGSGWKFSSPRAFGLMKMPGPQANMLSGWP